MINTSVRFTADIGRGDGMISTVLSGCARIEDVSTVQDAAGRVLKFALSLQHDFNDVAMASIGRTGART